MVNPPLPTRTRNFSRRLRREMTDAEQALWRLLRGSQLDGLKFRRQHPIPPYTVDFLCVSARLVIELDGSQHSAVTDRVRTAFLESRGFKVIRFWDNDVLTQIEAVAEAILKSAAHTAPHPSPAPALRSAQGVQPRASRWLASSATSPRRERGSKQIVQRNAGEDRHAHPVVVQERAETAVAVAMSRAEEFPQHQHERDAESVPIGRA